MIQEVLSVKCQVLRRAKAVVWTSNFTPYTSNSASSLLYKQTQFGGTPAPACRLGAARAGGTNKPNSARSRRGSPYQQTQFAPRRTSRRGRRWSRSCETNPIPPVGRRLGGGNMQNKPNSGRCGRRQPLSFQYSIISVRCRLCQTNPISCRA